MEQNLPENRVKKIAPPGANNGQKPAEEYKDGTRFGLTACPRMSEPSGTASLFWIHRSLKIGMQRKYKARLFDYHDVNVGVLMNAAKARMRVYGEP